MPFLAYENEGEINMFQIVEKRSLNPSMTLMVVKAPYIAKKAKAGQFIILRVNEKGERIPLTIADYDREVGTVTIIFQIVGKLMIPLLNTDGLKPVIAIKLRTPNAVIIQLSLCGILQNFKSFNRP